MKYISLFAGIGGFDLALNRLGHECVYVNEWDKYAAQTYEKNFTHKVDTRSITDVPAGEIPDHDLLVGGFPCQSFSVAGKRGGFNDTRGTMFFEIARILKDKRPTYLLLENVKGLLSHDNGRTFQTIMRSLDELGYDTQWQVLNSKNFGVPQNRERVFIVGHLRGTPRPKIFPIRANSQADIILPTLTARYWGGQANGGYIGNKPKQKIMNPLHNKTPYGWHFEQNIYDESGITRSLKAGGGSGNNAKVIQRIPLKFLQRNQKNIEGDYAFTVDSMNTGGVNDGLRIRRLTPLECERLQGFPDGHTEGVSDTQRYKQLGNAVTVNVVEAVVKLL